MNSLEIAEALAKMGFSQHEKERIVCFKRDDLPHPLYVKTSSEKSKPVRKAPLIVHPGYAKALEELDQIAGIRPDWLNHYHNSNLNGFPKEFHKGKTEIKYGIAVDVESPEALSHLVKIIAALNGLSKPPKPVSNAEDDIAVAHKELQELTETEKTQVILARRGQGSFRSALDSYWVSCAISDVTMPEFLRASHIKPWRDSSNHERLDPFNGILLNAALDIAFELGFISFNDDGAILIGRHGAQQLERELGVHSSMRLRIVDKRHAPYLSWHRSNIFKC